MNLNRLVAAILRAVAEELDPDSPPAEKPTVGNDAPLEVASWQPDDVEHHGLGFR